MQQQNRSTTRDRRRRVTVPSAWAKLPCIIKGVVVNPSMCLVVRFSVLAHIRGITQDTAELRQYMSSISTRHDISSHRPQIALHQWHNAGAPTRATRPYRFDLSHTLVAHHAVLQPPPPPPRVRRSACQPILAASLGVPCERKDASFIDEVLEESRRSRHMFVGAAGGRPTTGEDVLDPVFALVRARVDGER